MDKWTTADARARFADLARAAVDAPQLVLNRDRIVAVVIGPDEWARYEAWKRAGSVGAAFAELRALAEPDPFGVADRADRPNPFDE